MVCCVCSRGIATPELLHDSHRDALVEQGDLDDDDFAESLPSFGQSPDMDVPTNGHLQQLLMPESML
jgi:hypothetical protein